MIFRQVGSGGVTLRLDSIPRQRGVYALYGGREGSGRYVAYVGITGARKDDTGDIQDRVHQHLIRRDSSAVTGINAVKVDPDLIREVRWWISDRFSDRAVLVAAEIVATEILKPAYRDRGRTSPAARTVAADPDFQAEFKAFFSGPPSGSLEIPSLADAVERIKALEARLAELEKRVPKA